MPWCLFSMCLDTQQTVFTLGFMPRKADINCAEGRRILAEVRKSCLALCKCGYALCPVKSLSEVFSALLVYSELINLTLIQRDSGVRIFRFPNNNLEHLHHCLKMPWCLFSMFPDTQQTVFTLGFMPRKADINCAEGRRILAKVRKSCLALCKCGYTLCPVRSLTEVFSVFLVYSELINLTLIQWNNLIYTILKP